MENEIINFDQVINHTDEEQVDEIEEGINFESQLGKKEYWDSFYSKEIRQFQNNSDLIGEVWFGEQVQKKEVTYIREKFRGQENVIKILDVGCGNAAFILRLVQLGFTNLFGMDYAEKSIQFANQILKEKLNNEKLNSTNIQLYKEEINNPVNLFKEFDLIHDKGTFDAFMLNKENKAESYIYFILSKAKSNSFFIITSCNYSYNELCVIFLYEGSKFKIVESIPHKSFSFGGSNGQVVTSIVFSILL